MPSAAAIRQSLNLVNFKRLPIRCNRPNCLLLDKNMGVDLGGIAKNYILLQVRSLLAQQQVKHALINGGGDIYTLGQNPQGQPWTIGVQHPRNSQAIIGKVRLESWDQVATSGDYHRYFLVGDKRYHHIFDLKTGYPTNTLSSATLFSKFPAPTFPSSSLSNFRQICHFRIYCPTLSACTGFTGRFSTASCCHCGFEWPNDYRKTKLTPLAELKIPDIART